MAAILSQSQCANTHLIWRWHLINVVWKVFTLNVVHFQYFFKNYAEIVSIHHLTGYSYCFFHIIRLQKIEIFSFVKLKYPPKNEMWTWWHLKIHIYFDSPNMIWYNKKNTLEKFERKIKKNITASVNKFSMMMSSNGNIFHVTGHLCGEFTGHQRIPRTKANDVELWCFLWSAPE